ncbi:MAG: hypothetical protein LBM95_01075 [Lactobacillales bacterium]|jgi:ABC-type sugar transport system permease subunit|nr:hypothetical protein [Lactobacillales bacterium]
MKKHNSLPKNLPRLMLTFIGTIFLFLFLILLSIRVTLFNEKHMESVANKTEYYTKLTGEINKDIAGYALGSNVPEEVLKNAVPVETVEANVKNYFKAAYNPGVKYEITGTAELKTLIVDKINTYAKQEGKEVQSVESVNKLGDELVDIYASYVRLPFLVEFGQKITKYKNTLTMMTATMGVLWGLVSAALLVSLRGYKHRLMRFSSYSLIGAGLMGIGVPAYLLVKDIFANVGIQSPAMYQFLTSYINSFLWMFIIIGLVLVVLGIISAILSEKTRRGLTGY